MASHSHERISSGETGALHELRTLAEQLQSPQRNLAPRPDASDIDQEAGLEAQTGTKKQRRRPAEAKVAADAQAAPSAAESGDQASDPGPRKKGKPGTKHRRKALHRKTKNRGRISIRESAQAATCWTSQANLHRASRPLGEEPRSTCWRGSYAYNASAVQDELHT